MNIGARSVSTGADYPSKAALKRAIAADPSDVLFYSTEMFTVLSVSEFRASEIPADVTDTMYLTGPDPYRSRKYYATVTRRFAGAVKPGTQTVIVK
jgi:hypothetical protein